MPKFQRRTVAEAIFVEAVYYHFTGADVELYETRPKRVLLKRTLWEMARRLPIELLNQFVDFCDDSSEYGGRDDESESAYSG